MTAEAKRRAVAAAAAFAVIAGIALFNRFVVRSGPPASHLLVLSASVAIVAVAIVSVSRERVLTAGSTAAAVSLLTSLVHVARNVPQDAFWIVGEAMALLTLTVVVIRWAPLRKAVITGSAVAAVMALSVVRVQTPAWSLEMLGAVLTWMSGGAAAAALGSYLRALDTRRTRMIEDARRTQRLELARDLHDFVAHDVTGIVVQAQAGRVVASRNPEEAIATLARIEDAGLRALGSLDRSVHMLGDLAVPAPATDSHASTLEDVFALVGRFAVTDHTPVHLRGHLPRSIPVDVSSTAYRVVLEALTNVRRHARATERVEVSIAAHDDAGVLAVHVTNEATTGHAAALQNEASRGGRGLTALNESVTAMGGMFEAGAFGASGWRVTAILPVRS